MKKRLIGLCAGLLALVPLCAQAAPVLIDGKLWMQPINFINLSPNDVSAVCNQTTGACNGTLNGHDVTGMTWAASAEVGAMFEAIGVPNFTASDPNIGSTLNSAWAPYFFTLFTPTLSTIDEDRMTAFTRTLVPPGFDRVWTGTIRDFLDSAVQDIASTSGQVSMATSSGEVGVWIYASAPVPTPAPLLLMALGGLGLGFARKRRSRQERHCL